MDSEDNIHKKPRMEEEKDAIEDVEPIKVVSLLYKCIILRIFILPMTIYLRFTTTNNFFLGIEMERKYVPSGAGSC